MLLLPASMNGILRQNGDTVVPHLTSVQTLICPTYVGQMFLFKETPETADE